MKSITFLLIFLFALGQIGRFTIPGLGIPIQINDLAVTVISLVWFLKPIHWTEAKKDWLTKPLLFWIGAMLISLLLNFPRLTRIEFIVSASYFLRFIAYSGLYFVGKSLYQTPKNFEVWLFAFLIVAVLGLTQYHFLPSIHYFYPLGWDDHYYRLVSTFFDPGFTGAILTFGLVYLFLSNLGNFAKTIGLGVLYFSLALTYSRASFAMFLTSFGIISFLTRRPAVILISVILIALTILFLPKTAGEGTKLGREYSIWSRINNWKQSLEVWQDSPIFGVGYNSYRYSLIQHNVTISADPITSHGGGADSSLMLVLATTGVVGFAAFSNLGLQIVKRNRRNVLFLATAAGLFVHSWFNNTLFYPWAMEWFWLLLAFSQKSL